MNMNNCFGDTYSIPKVLHYCWFSGDPIPEEYLYYLQTWKSLCPNYEIMQWNADNFKIENMFAREAYLSKKWAFVTDYARLKILYDYGGIYLDLDVELLKKFDDLLHYKFFMGLETENSISTCVIGSEPRSNIIGELLSYYDNAHFVNEDGSFNQTTNVKIISTQIEDIYGLKLSNNITYINESSVILPIDYFSPKNYFTGKITTTNNTYTIHHFGESWKDIKEVTRLKKVHEIYDKYRLNLNRKSFFGKLFHRIIVVYAHYSLYGFGDTLCFIHSNLR